MVRKKPFGRRNVVNMHWPGQCNEDIDVKEARHASFIASRTTSGVIG